MHTISQAINFPLLAGPNSVVLLSSVDNLLLFPCWQEELQQILQQMWAVPVLTRGSLQEFLPIGYATMLSWCLRRCKLPPEPLLLLDLEAVALGCGFSNVCQRLQHLLHWEDKQGLTSPYAACFHKTKHL